jgi:hypothetical protein
MTPEYFYTDLWVFQINKFTKEKRLPVPKHIKDTSHGFNKSKPTQGLTTPCLKAFIILLLQLNLAATYLNSCQH